MTGAADPFEWFLRQRGKDRRRIVRATRGEYGPADVVQEAWPMAGQLSARHGVEADFSDPGFQERLISHLYQALVRHAGLHVRHGYGRTTPAATRPTKALRTG
ncbi:hypothetical protein OK348_06770 [Flavobacterium sp. MXW15]|uniref:Uncharacterized protein n=1 Tax=Xanthomonas chitinilytica TaxID=2989819 RepID=A0ABT3JTB5_9XANT|nr:hypothetical protein [Xanthomonas sp. H13-6]MCW4454495.1 hypothetical protein [Flavobacterium sp. MXW15]MCW4471734.1 hypothetical protein [Xanthomonas sp. H13-6]